MFVHHLCLGRTDFHDMILMIYLHYFASETGHFCLDASPKCVLLFHPLANIIHDKWLLIDRQ